MLAVTGGKGGCGKTTTTVALAAALARAGAQPLVVDCDCDMPALHHATGTAREHGIDAVAAGTAPRVVSQEATQAGVRVVTAGRRANVGAALTRLAARSGPVLLDTPGGATPGATRPLRHADRALLVTTTTPQCLDDTARTATTAREFGVTIDGVVVHHRDDPADPTRFVCDDTRFPVLANVPTVEGDPLSDPRIRDAFDSAVAGLSPTAACLSRQRSEGAGGRRSRTGETRVYDPTGR